MAYDPRNMARASVLAADIRKLLTGRDRVIIGVTGEPGSGKSTLAEQVAATLYSEGIPAVRLPLDGFHLSNAILRALGRRERKGAIDTFDADGFISVLERIAAGSVRTIYAPSYDHGFGEPIAGSIAIEPNVQVVIAEGNYVLDPSEPWNRIRSLVTQSWYIELDDAVRRARLLERHIATGKAEPEAAAWIDAVDEKNAERIRLTKQYADRIIARV
jgi:pantothenate kinase